MPDFPGLASGVKEVDNCDTSCVANLSEDDFDQAVGFVFTDGSAARTRRGEIILHVYLHGTYHRGNTGIVLYGNGITPNDDRMTDFLETAA